MKERIEVLRKLRDACDDLANALEADNEKDMESAAGRFLMAIIKIQETK